MDELTDKITQLLNDPGGMDMVKNIANSLMSGENSQNGNESGSGIGGMNLDMGALSGLLGGLSENSQGPQNADNSGDNLPLSPTQLKSLMNVLMKMKSGGENERIKLLKALRPHLSEERQKKTDTAIKILKLIDMLPMLKEAGLGDLF